MDSGKLKNEITLKRRVSTKDAQGGAIVTYVPVATVAAAADPIRSREFVTLQTALAEIDVRFTLYYRSDVTAAWRVEWRGQDYEIVGQPIDVKGERIWMEIFCRTAQT